MVNNMFGQQWSSKAQRNKIYQVFDTNTILVSRINLLLILVVFFMGVVDSLIL